MGLLFDSILDQINSLHIKKDNIKEYEVVLHRKFTETAEWRTYTHGIKKDNPEDIFGIKIAWSVLAKEPVIRKKQTKETKQ